MRHQTRRSSRRLTCRDCPMSAFASRQAAARQFWPPIRSGSPRIVFCVPMRRPCSGSSRRRRSASKPWLAARPRASNRRALADRFGENVRDHGRSQDALYAKRADYDGGAVVIVATIQAFRVEETEGRKVYEANGELMDHFTGLAEGLRAALESGPSGEPVQSLANVLRFAARWSLSTKRITRAPIFLSTRWRG